jgi:hypothetical protein
MCCREEKSQNKTEEKIVLLALQKIPKTMHQCMWRKPMIMALSTRGNIPPLRIPRQILPALLALVLWISRQILPQALLALAQNMQAPVPMLVLARVTWVTLAHMQAPNTRWITQVPVLVLIPMLVPIATVLVALVPA